MNVYKYLRGGYEVDRARLLSVVPRAVGSWRPAPQQHHWGSD